jgi:hypothetical protein
MAEVHSIASASRATSNFCAPLPRRVRGAFAAELARLINARGRIHGRDLAAFCDEEGELWLTEPSDDCERTFRQPSKDEAVPLAVELGAKPVRLAYCAA